MAKKILPQDPLFEKLFSGTVSLEKNDRWIQPWRLPFRDRDLFTVPDGIFVDRGQSTSGCRLCFETDSEFLRIYFDLIFHEAADPLEFALVQNNMILNIIKADKNAGYADFHLPASGKYEIWLHPFFGFRIKSLEIDENSTLSSIDDRRIRWVSYGSSITMGRQAVNGASTWPATAARKLDLNLTNLGYGGQCHVDPLMADIILDKQPDIVTLKLGINVYGGSTLNLRTFRIAIMGLLYRLRQQREKLPIGIISPIYCSDREDTPNNVDMTLKDYRSEVEAAYQTFINRGDKFLTYTHGYDLLGPAEAHMMPDNLHPDPAGYKMMGERAAEKVIKPLLDMIS